MKLWYITNMRIPTEKAHGLQIVKMGKAFTHPGIEVQLIVPFRRQSPQMQQVESVWKYYEVMSLLPIQLPFVPILSFR